MRSTSGSAGALRTARPGMLLDDERVVVVDAIGERAGDRASIEEERRGGVDPDARAGLDVLADARARRRVVEAGSERLHVEPELARVAEEALALEVLVVLEEDVVVLPEPSLPARALGRAGRQAGVGVGRARDLAVAARVALVLPEDEADVEPVAQHVTQVADGLD